MNIKAVKDIAKKLKKMKAKGEVVDPKALTECYKRECSFQVDYTPEYECEYRNNQIIDIATGTAPPPDIVSAIEGRVKLLKPTLKSSADELIDQLEGSEEFKW